MPAVMVVISHLIPVSVVNLLLSKQSSHGEYIGVHWRVYWGVYWTVLLASCVYVQGEGGNLSFSLGQCCKITMSKLSCLGSIKGVY